MINEIAYTRYHKVIASELRVAIRRYYDMWEDLLLKDEPERESWISMIEQPRVSIVVLSCALVEYAINFFICAKCDAKEFARLDRKSLFEKWTEVPKLFPGKYLLPEKSQLCSDLSKLIARRKAIVHAKPKMSVDGDNRHSGNEPLTVLDEHEFVGRCATLPFRLIEHLRGFFPDDVIIFFSIHCLGAVANEFDDGQRRLAVAAKYPRELIKEIMQQEYDRNTAVLCAILMGDKPKFDEAGNIRIFVGLGKVITLKPLKFFAAKNKLP